MKRQSEAMRRVLAQHCPRCGAMPGIPCVSKAGDTTPHMGRMRAATAGLPNPPQGSK